MVSNRLTPAEAASMKGRLYFYLWWVSEAKGWLACLSARQYSRSKHLASQGWPLTEALQAAFVFFLKVLSDSVFTAGVKPERFFNRDTVVVYTDGSLSDTDPGGIGGVVLRVAPLVPLWFGEQIEEGHFYRHIACVEMEAILRACDVFAEHIAGKAVVFFVDNTHAIGCLLRGGASVLETDENFLSSSGPVAQGVPSLTATWAIGLPADIRLSMNTLCQLIWKRLTTLDVVVWWEYVNTKHNLADDPSRRLAPFCGGLRVGDESLAMRPPETQ